MRSFTSVDRKKGQSFDYLTICLSWQRQYYRHDVKYSSDLIVCREIDLFIIQNTLSVTWYINCIYFLYSIISLLTFNIVSFVKYKTMCVCVVSNAYRERNVLNQNFSVGTIYPTYWFGS